jgi:pimeloyl-ACP methyl ester carboxylesterase
MKIKLLTVSFILSLSCSLHSSAEVGRIRENKMFCTKDNYLSRPTGHYKIGFKDFHWINQNLCPDVNFNEKNSEDFSQDNKSHCREVMVRIYYPSMSLSMNNSFYYKPFIKWKKKDLLDKLPSIPKDQIKQLSNLKSFTLENVAIADQGKFPTLLFCPGFGLPAQIYENYIGELVSHGYIVIGINSPFINRVALPNGHVIEEAQAKSFDEFEKILVPLQIKDLFFVLDQIKLLKDSEQIFAAMDLKKIGALGHSIGGRVIADAAHAHPEKFQAAATLDIGIDESGKSLKKFLIPFMHIISANRKTIPQVEPILFELGKNNYLVGIAKNEQDHEYSKHDNFTDLSTLQDLPALKTLTAHNQLKFNRGFKLILLSHKPSKVQQETFDKMTYVLIKKDEHWNLFIYEQKKKINEIDVTMVDGLDSALASLPKKTPELFTGSEIKPIKRIMVSLHQILGASYLGVGNGSKITTSINSYLLEFFDTFLKGKQNSLLERNEYQSLSNDSYIKNGPGEF